jgi:3-deoxy-D-manno-octulosonic-acid transferase
VLAPRHPERFAGVCELLGGMRLRWQRRSEWDGGRPIAGGVLLLDTIGELASLYQFADLAFIGGSLFRGGGHNVLEAAQFGVPILVGPHTENFRDIIEVFRKVGALLVVTPESLASTVLQLLENSGARARLARRASCVLLFEGGATKRTVRALLQLLPESARATAPLSSEKPA